MYRRYRRLSVILEARRRSSCDPDAISRAVSRRASAARRLSASGDRRTSSVASSAAASAAASVASGPAGATGTAASASHPQAPLGALQ